jgi:hypothetical protein
MEWGILDLPLLHIWQPCLNVMMPILVLNKHGAPSAGLLSCAEPSLLEVDHQDTCSAPKCSKWWVCQLLLLCWQLFKISWLLIDMVGLSASRLPSCERGIYFQVSICKLFKLLCCVSIMFKSYLCNTVAVLLNVKNITAASSSVYLMESIHQDVESYSEEDHQNENQCLYIVTRLNDYRQGSFG